MSHAERGAPAASTSGPAGWLGAEGCAAALLLLLCAGLLTAPHIPGLGQALTPAAAWLPLAAAAGLAAGLAGLLGLWRRRPARTGSGRAGGSAAPLLQALAEETSRLRQEGVALSRSLAQAGETGTRMAEAARTATASLDAGAESAAIAARTLALLPDMTDGHLARIERTAAHVEHAFALVPEGLAARLEQLPAEVAAAVAAEHAAADTRLLQRVEAMGATQTGQGYDGSLRLASLLQRLERVGEALLSLGELMPQRLEQVADGLETRLGMSVPPLLDRLEELAAPIEAAGNTLARQAGTVEEALGRALAEQQAQLGSLSAEVARGIREEAAAFTATLAETGAAEARLWTQRIEDAAGLLQQQTAALAAAAWPAVEAQADILSARIGGAAEAAGAALAALADTVPEAVIPILHARMAEVLQGQLIDPLQARLALMVEELRPPTEALSRLATALPARCEALAEAVAAPADVARRLEAASLALEAAAREATLALAGTPA